MATMSYFAFLILVGHSLLPYLLTVSFANENDLIITTKDGKVQGKVLSVVGGEVRAFLGGGQMGRCEGCHSVLGKKQVFYWE